MGTTTQTTLHLMEAALAELACLETAGVKEPQNQPTIYQTLRGLLGP